jgi:hypothetical protein
VSPRDDAARLIRTVLAEGPRAAGEVERLAADDGIAVRTLRRAADDLHVIRTRVGRFTLWALPTPQTAPADGGGTSFAGATSSDDRKDNDMSDDDRTDYVMCTETGLTWPGYGVLTRGDVVELPRPGTPQHAATVGQDGVSWLDDLSPAAQTARWGVVFLARLDKGAAEQDAAARTANDLDADPARRAPIRPDALGVVLAPGLAARPEGSVPFLTSSGIVADDRR